MKRVQWRHADDEPKRDDVIARTVSMLEELIEWSDAEGLRLAPIVGIGCPGRVQEDGSILNGAQNLPGNWQSSRFKLPIEIRDKIPRIGRSRYHGRDAQ